MSISRNVFGYMLMLGLAAAVAIQGQAGSPLIGKTIHVYNPAPGDSVFVDLSGTGHRMKADPGNWVSLTITSAIVPGDWLKDFAIRSNYGQGSWTLARTGLGGTGSYTAEDFKGGTELWIILDPSLPRTAAPALLTAPPKIVNVLNPWPTTAPTLVFAGGKKNMLTIDSICGWFTAFLIQPEESRFHFAEISGAETFGSGGYGSTDPYNLDAEFSAKGNALWLDKDANAWSKDWPGKLGLCEYQMAATVRDFSLNNLDFDFSSPLGNALIKGAVEKNLRTTDRRPVRSTVPGMAGGTNIFNDFESWWKTDETNSDPAKRSFETCVDIPMGKTGDGMWEFDSYRTPSRGFWPIDDFNKHNENSKTSCYVDPLGQYKSDQPPHNMNFCMESHAKFIYTKGQTFSFRGDDDVWVFINDKLVIDLGGIHEAKADSVKLDTLGLVENKEYTWDFFYCERQPCGSSLRIKTSIFFKQQRALDHVEIRNPDGTTGYRIIKRVGGTGSCGSSADSLKEVAPGKLIFTLFTAGGVKIQDLSEGVNLGGITIHSPMVTTDTSKITALPAGTYRIVYYEEANSKLQDEVRFTIPARNQVQFEPPYSIEAPAGSLVPVVAANRYLDNPPTGIAKYTVDIPASLEVFADKAKTQPLKGKVELSTEANGLDTLWVTGGNGSITDVTGTLSVVIPISAKSVKLTFILPPLDLPTAASATAHDDDADGVIDRVAAVYDRDISALPPKAVTFRWPATADPVGVPNDKLASGAVGGTFTYTGKISAQIVTSGTGVYTSAYAGRGKDSVQTLPLKDGIAPVLLSSEMAQGQAFDTLHLRFSEPVAPNALGEKDLFVYRLSQNGVDVQFEPVTAAWNASRDQVGLIFPSGVDEAPRPGNSIRIMDGSGRLADAAGNSPGPNSRFRLITGVKRVEIKTVTFKKIDPDLIAANTEVFTVTHELANVQVEEVVQRNGRLGHLIKADLGDYAQADDFTTVDPAQVALDYQVNYFTNLGIPVASQKRTISCQDDVYGGDCRAKRGYLFIGWNYTTLQKQRAATGAYIVRLQYKIRVGTTTPASGKLEQIWGVIRGR
jgi:fibro-slime domain-containing protein